MSESSARPFPAVALDGAGWHPAAWRESDACPDELFHRRILGRPGARRRGLRRAGALIAMAGRRLRPPGWTEISAVCTDPAYRGQGLATRLVRAVAAGIRERGDTPFLHTTADNTNAIRLYESIGFTLVSRRTNFMVVRVPAGRPAAGKPVGPYR